MSFLFFCSVAPFPFPHRKRLSKSNLLSAANGALNAGVEYAFGPKSTFDLSGSIRPWKRTEGYVNKYWLIQPEYRYWTCQKFNGSFGEPISTERSST